MRNSVPRSASPNLTVVLMSGGSNGMVTEDMYSETTFCRKTLTQSRVKSLKRFEPFKSWTLLYPFCILLLILIGCDTDQTLTHPVRHTVEISELSLTNQTIEAGGTATVTVTFDYSGDAADLIFRWEGKQRANHRGRVKHHLRCIGYTRHTYYQATVDRWVCNG